MHGRGSVIGEEKARNFPSYVKHLCACSFLASVGQGIFREASLIQADHRSDFNSPEVLECGGTGLQTARDPPYMASACFLFEGQRSYFYSSQFSPLVLETHMTSVVRTKPPPARAHRLGAQPLQPPSGFCLLPCTLPEQRVALSQAQSLLLALQLKQDAAKEPDPEVLNGPWGENACAEPSGDEGAAPLWAEDSHLTPV